MSNLPLTIGETVADLREVLRDYVEATYHIGHPEIVAQRRALLEQEGVLHQTPYIESTPRYQPGKRFEELSIPEPVRDLLATLATETESSEARLHDPPYKHQARALEESITNAKSLVVTTGTGSGKTESFLLPILAKLTVEASQMPEGFARPAVRALLLYPMNALVNDQLGRLRLLFGDTRVTDFFEVTAGRPARFARYTSRTLYPGVRSAKRDQVRLKAIDEFYVKLLMRSRDRSNPAQQGALDLIASLKSRGKWPAKPDLAEWYGEPGTRWTDKDGNFRRAVTCEGDAELLTRHEVLATPPDILVTNYSMLEYMLMRPLEQPVFDATAAWLRESPSERLLLVVDEAHLYRGAGGTEVGLLLRRLRTRLGIPEERLQVITTSASFADTDHARRFAAELTGKSEDGFVSITGDLALRPNAAPGDRADAEALAAIDLTSFYDAPNDEERIACATPFFARVNVTPGADAQQSLYAGLENFPPLASLVNRTMSEAVPVPELGRFVFPGIDSELADRAVTALIALASVARRRPEEPGLLPCRVHAFFRGLPGLWACLDPKCGGGDGNRPIGQLFPQPHDACPDCGSRVYEFYTCRHCGTAYARAYTHSVEEPEYLWQEPGARFMAAGGAVYELEPLDLLLEDPVPEAQFDVAALDLVTGRLNPPGDGHRVRTVFLNGARTAVVHDEEGEQIAPSGEFRPCGACRQTAGFGRSSVQDHQTKGDQPFQSIISRQLEVQPPGPQPATDFAPLRGRKVLAFSDSRQTAARLAPNLQSYSTRDVLRPLILAGWGALSQVPGLAPSLSLENLYLAVLVAAQQLGVRLRPELRLHESLHAMAEVRRLVQQGALADAGAVFELLQAGQEAPPESLLAGIYATVVDRFTGLQSLALASIRERETLVPRIVALPGLDGFAESDDAKLLVARTWLQQWATGPGIWFQGTPNTWWKAKRTRDRPSINGHAGKFQAIDRWLPDTGTKKTFRNRWLPELLDAFAEVVAAPNVYRLRAGYIALDTAGPWAYCEACRTTQRPFPGSRKCVVCGRERVTEIDPETDQVFSARKAYYRNGAIRALSEPPDQPMAIIAAEHTAQLGTAQADQVFSRAEEHELLFQDVDLGDSGVTDRASSAVDVLSCTTTMEVGIDIGALSGVALRNMPPSRASYQQRSGRAGRRGNAIATVVAFGSSDSHDEHYFREPDAIIRGSVDDPSLTLDNEEIARRHVTAYLLQRYHQFVLPSLNPEDNAQLFEVLGTVDAFLSGDGGGLSRAGFVEWMTENEAQLVAAIDDWLPTQIAASERQRLLDDLVHNTLAEIDKALELPLPPDAERAVAPVPGTEDDSDALLEEVPDEVGVERPSTREGSRKLLDRLLYSGVLPRYAFPTDVVAFHVFDKARSTRYRPAYLYAPGQGLPVALTQYAPGKEVWIDGKLWSSGALYSPYGDERFAAWRDRKVYLECNVCRYARTQSRDEVELKEKFDCPACGTESSLGPARNWIRPPGFAHPQAVEEGTSPEDQPARSYATRAKLIASTPAESDLWHSVSDRIRRCFFRGPLLVTNSGPAGDGYSYCTKCGLIEPSASVTLTVTSPHPKPYPDEKDPTCSGMATHGLVLGTDFISDVLLLGFQVEAPMLLRPGHLATDVALRTLAEAITIGAARRLGIDRGEVQAEYRPALTPGGREGLEAEIYLYDTLAGGAGFSRRIGDVIEAVLHESLSILENCAGECDRSCYRCLRSFDNRFEHELLDRHLGAHLLRYVLFGEEPQLEQSRLDAAADRVFSDLSNRGLTGIEVQRDVDVQFPGLGTVRAPIVISRDSHQVVVGIHGPLTPDYTSSTDLRDAKEFGSSIPVVLVDEIVVARNLPHAAQAVLEAIERS